MSETSAGARPEAAPRRLHLRVLRVEEGSGGLTMAFVGYETPEAARVLTGLDIMVARDRAAPLKDNEWYVADLVGLDLTHEGRVVARIRSVLEGGPDPWLEVVVPESGPGDAPDPAAGGSSGTAKRNPERAKRNPERVSLVPFRGEFVGSIDLLAGRVELLAPWLLDP